MKTLFLIILSALLSLSVRGQSATGYPQHMDEASAAMQARKFCDATAIFERAFAPDSAQASVFDLFAAALSSAQCPAKQPLAWRWLGQLSRRRPLPMQAGDLDNIAADPGLASLRANEPAWARWLTTMRGAIAEQAVAEKTRRARWLSETQARALALPSGADRKQGRVAPAPAGFALYFSQVPGDTVRMPYLVRVPAGYDPARPAPVVVYLHGGLSIPQFRHANPEVATQEPIFAAAPANALVVYPFGRKSFGWVEQPAAFAQVLRIVAEVRARYRTAPAQTTLVGMSNGGSATLWFAAQPTAPFSRFVALAPAPKLLLAQSTYGPLGKTKPVLMVSAEDDDLYAYAAVRAAYDANRAGRPNWVLQTVPKGKGGHGFLYSPEGLALLRQALRSTAAKPGQR
jgi:pimeloyl-ACP methyl ester carboxylesterase